MAQLYTQGKLPAAESLALSRALQHNSQHTPSVAFREFGQWRTYSLIKGLSALWQAVNKSIEAFANEV
jgi:hypothetical protein